MFIGVSRVETPTREVWLRQQTGFLDDAQHRAAKLAFA